MYTYKPTLLAILVIYYQDMYRSHDFILRSRHNNDNLFAKKEPVANKNSEQENEKTER